MSRNTFTPAQNRAITTRGCDLLVAAAAGSGKTAVLVERVIMLITEKSVDIDRLLVVTFTEAAASEMRQRIGEALFEKLDAEPENENIRRQTALLNKARISTIHSFCLDVVRRYCYLLDIDPGFKISDQIETQLLKADVLAELFEEAYAAPEEVRRTGGPVARSETADPAPEEVRRTGGPVARSETADPAPDNQPFLDLVDSYGGTKTDDAGLARLIEGLHTFMSNLPWPSQWLTEKLDMFSMAGSDGFSPWFSVIIAQVKTTLEGVLESIQDAMRVAAGPYGPNQYIDALDGDRQTVTAMLRLCDGSQGRAFVTMENLFEAFSGLAFTELSRKKGAGEVSEENKSKVKRSRDDDVKKVMNRLKSAYFSKPPQTLMQELENVRPVLETLCAVTLDFDAAYQQAKKERNIVDFNDLEHFCLQILLDPSSTPDSPVPSKAARELAQTVDEIMIDEYQDENAVQELILSLIANENPGNRFMVGDIKQSIYKFRRANPDIFLEKYRTFDRTPGAKRQRVDLSKNFRSRDIVLSAVNFLFEQLMTEEVGEITYAADAALYPGIIFPDSGEAPVADAVELHVLAAGKNEADEDDTDDAAQAGEENLTKVEMEARFVAERVHAMTDGEDPLFVQDKETGLYRRVQYRDIVILARSVKDAADAFFEAFKARSVPLLAEKNEGYFSAVEVITALSLLQIIDNPRQDIPLITVLRSPIYQFSDDELLRIRQARPKHAFYDALLACAANTDAQTDAPLANKFTAILSDLEKWRMLAVYTPISDLIGVLYEDTGYENIVGVLPGGKARQANLLALREKAAAYEATSYKGLFHFNKYIDKLQKQSQDTGNAKIFSENENVVRMMTIHKSKGLEFPVVFVALLGKQFSKADEKENVILHETLGFGPVYVDLARRVKTKTTAYAAIAARVRRENLSEEMRMLYVALTRAKEKLILTGNVRQIERRLEKWGKYAGLRAKALPVHYMTAADCFLDWICSAVARHRDGAVLRSADVSGVAQGNADIFCYDARFKVFVHTSVREAVPDTARQTDKARAYKDLLAMAAETGHGGQWEEVERKLGWVYPYLPESGLPAKISISEIKRIYQREHLDAYAQISVYERPVYARPSFLGDGGGITGARLGTLIHTVMEHLDVHAHTDFESISALVDRLIRKSILNSDEACAIPIQKIVTFAQSGLAERMRQSTCLKKETPFVMGLRPDEIYGVKQLEALGLKNSDATVLVHGIIDCYFIEKNKNGDDEIILIDYKSDHAANDQAIVEKYGIQLKLYKKALERSLGLAVAECVLYLFSKDCVINI